MFRIGEKAQCTDQTKISSVDWKFDDHGIPMDNMLAVRKTVRGSGVRNHFSAGPGSAQISRRGFVKGAVAVAASAGGGLVPANDVKAKDSVSRDEMPGKFKVAAVQMNALRGDLGHNLAVHRQMVSSAAKDGCALILFPELSVTAHYGHGSVVDLAETATGGVIYKTMHGLAKQHRIIVSYGFCEILRGANFNSQAMVGPDGMIGIHRKVHASRDEYTYFRMGRSLEVFDVGFCRIGILICYDADFFEAWRVLALKGANVLLLPHAARSGVGKRIPRDKQLKDLEGFVDSPCRRFRVYGSDNNVFAVYANQADYNGHSTHCGGAAILSPGGDVPAISRPVLDDHLITAKIDLREQDSKRKSGNSTLKDRRPEVYGELVRMI